MQRFTPDLRILDPVNDVAVTAGDSLSSLDTTKLPTGALCFVKTNAGGHPAGYWGFERDSTAAAGVDVVVPASGPGRWFWKMGTGASLPEENVEVWVSQATGDDSNPGTEAEPWASLAPARELIGFGSDREVIVNIGPGTYEELELFHQPLFATQSIVLRGSADLDGLEVLQDFVEIDSQTGILLDCSTAAPGWTVDEWAGYHVWVYAADQTTLLARFTVASNTADTISTVAPKSFNAPAGSFVRVGRPSAKIIYAEYTAQQSTSSPIQGTATAGVSSFGIRAQKALVWENICWQVPAAQYPTFRFAGSHAAIGLMIETSAVSFGASTYIEEEGMMWSGAWAESGGAAQEWWPGITNEDMAGYGFSMRDTVDAVDWGYFENRGIFIGSIVSACHHCEGESYIIGGYRFTSGQTYNSYATVEAWSNSNVQIYDVLEASNGDASAQIGVAGETFAPFYVHFDGRLEMFDVLNVNGDPTRYAWTRRGFVRVAHDSPTFGGAGSLILRAMYGGTIRLEGPDPDNFDWLGDAEAGNINVVTRPAAAWAEGDNVNNPTDGGSAIFRDD